MQKNFPIGISDFKEIITGNYYYTDKSLFIKDIIEDGSYPVIYLTFKDEKHSTWENCRKGFTMLFSKL